MNKLISHCAVYNNRIWLYQVDENILAGLNCFAYYNDQQFHSAKFIDRAWGEPLLQSSFPTLPSMDLTALKYRLQESEDIPLEVKAYHVSMSLWNRREYRSAIIEISVALDHIIGKTLRKKMANSGLSNEDIDRIMKQNRPNFGKLCNKLLGRYAGRRFCDDEPKLFRQIVKDRENYRHLIAHSNKSPDKHTIEKIIGNFKRAIEYFSAIN